MKAHYGDIGIVNIIRQRLKDIEVKNNPRSKFSNLSN